MEELLQRARSSEFEAGRDDPVYFIEHYCKIEDKDAPGVIVPFHLWDAQREAVRSLTQHKYNIVLKARQLGLTWLALALAVHTMLYQPGATVVALSRTENEAKELVRRVRVMLAHMDEFVLPQRAAKEQDGAWDWFTFEARAMSVDVQRRGQPTSVFKAFTSSPAAARSFTASLILFDEWAYQQYAEEIWVSGLPTVNRETGGRVIGLSTMQLGTLFEDIWRHNKRFYRVFLPWNADPRRTNEWYEQTKDVLGERVFQEYPASPEEALSAPGGCFFDELRRQVHVIEPFDIPAHWRRYHAIDYGLDMLASLWVAFDPEDNAYVYREVYESNLIIPQAAEAMAAAEQGEDIYARFAPPDLFGRSNESGRTRADIFAEYGFPFERASADRAAGWANLKDWLRVIDCAGGGQTARLRIFKNCENLIRTLFSLPRDKRRPNDCAHEPHELTHAPDALRYLFSQRPFGSPVRTDRSAEQYYHAAEALLDYGSRPL